MANLLSAKWKPGTDWKEQHLTTRLLQIFTDWSASERAPDDDKFNEQLERVIKALRADGGARERPPTPRL